MHTAEVAHDHASKVAEQIEAASWMQLRGEAGSHIWLSHPMVTHNTLSPGGDIHGSNPMRLRGISGQRLVSRYDLNPETHIVTQLRFSSHAARKILCRSTHSIDMETGTLRQEPRKWDHAVSGLGTVSFRRFSKSWNSRSGMGFEEGAAIQVTFESGRTLDSAMKVVRQLETLLEFMAGIPETPSVVSIGDGEIPPEVVRPAQNYRSETLSALEILDQADFDQIIGGALDALFKGARRFVSQMNAAMWSLHRTTDLTTRLGWTLPTLEQVARRYPSTAAAPGFAEMKAAFADHLRLRPDLFDFMEEHVNFHKSSMGRTINTLAASLNADGANLPDTAGRDISRLRNDQFHEGVLRASTSAAAQTHRMAVAILIMATSRDLGIPLDRMRSGRASPLREVSKYLPA